jgi:hypothetical protein
MTTETHDSAETVARGKRMYNAQIRERVESRPDAHGKMVALDVNTGEFELGRDALTALDALRSRMPNARVYVVRVGDDTAARIGVGRGITGKLG